MIVANINLIFFSKQMPNALVVYCCMRSWRLMDLVAWTLKRRAIKNKRPRLEFSLVLISSLPLVSWSRTFQCDLEWAWEPLPLPRLSGAQSQMDPHKAEALLMPILITLTLTQAHSKTHLFFCFLNFLIFHFKEASWQTHPINFPALICWVS